MRQRHAGASSISLQAGCDDPCHAVPSQKHAKTNSLTEMTGPLSQADPCQNIQGRQQDARPRPDPMFKTQRPAPKPCGTWRGHYRHFGRCCQLLGVREDPVRADPPPPHGRLAIDLGPLPGGAAVGIVLAPGHLPDAALPLNLLDSHARRPRVRLASCRAYGSGVKPWHGCVEETLVLVCQTTKACVKLLCTFELQISVSPTPARKLATNSSGPSVTMRSPRAISSSTSRSPACHSSVQYHA